MPVTISPIFMTNETRKQYAQFLHSGQNCFCSASSTPCSIYIYAVRVDKGIYDRSKVTAERLALLFRIQEVLG